MRVTQSNGTITLEAEGTTHKEVFKELSDLQEVFDHKNCGKCDGDNLRFIVRNVEDNDFFELHCANRNCRARLSFGQHKKGGSLFPKRKDAEGGWLNNNGWLVYNKATGKEE